ncbi:hypothetical protein LPJ66_008618 [Kickxella alabastrina]|uniref:Uncharacterized protein n=1 Tax=Kickxella alabastrina TaxID=61397 RepID=A0ACC1I5K2_9FUNG|nr:hypothetical protein LPJ66_008618 [Kickxella alabastrina]
MIVKQSQSQSLSSGATAIVDEAARQLGAFNIAQDPLDGALANEAGHHPQKAAVILKREATKGKKQMLRRATADEMKSFEANQPTLFQLKEFADGVEPKRLIFIGDIHGCLTELNLLLEKVKFTPGEDQVVMVGDLVAKGPESVGVVRRARKIGAWCVRGNHDDPVVRWREFLDGPGMGVSVTELTAMEKAGSLPYSDFQITAKPHFEIARKLSPADFTFMSKFPTILALPEPFSEWVVAHGGLDPSKAISKQNQDDVMTVRNIENSKPTSEKDVGMAWFEMWAAKMKLLNPSAEGSSGGVTSYDQELVKKVIYGHDASRALQINEYTKGLDSRCVYGGELTAFILPGEELVSVKCSNYEGSSGTKDRRRNLHKRGGSNSLNQGKGRKGSTYKKRSKQLGEPKTVEL